ncbi:MAG: SRPBCC family protein [Actinomycetota bacterium]|nr:SRPBCC family protein [Actinomycetota bacterium]
MTQIDRAIDIDAPPEAVFDELVDLHRLDRWSTITVSHEGSTDTLQAGHEFKQSIRIAGINLPTEWRCVQYDPPNAVAYEATALGGGRLEMRQVVTLTDAGSRVELTVDYDLPGGFLGDLLDRLYVERRNEREAEHSLQNLKDLVERRPPG